MATANLIRQETALTGRIVTTSITETAVTIKAEFEDRKTGVAREPQASTNVFTLSKDTDRFETIFADSHTTSGGVTTITVNAAGRDLLKYGILSGDASGSKHPINSEIGCAEVHLGVEELNNVIDGTLGTSSNTFRVGDETDSDIYYYAQNADGNKPYIKYDAGTSKWVFANDGSSETDVGGGTGSITAGDGIDITAGVVSLDLKSNAGLEIDTTELAIKLVSDGGIDVGANGLEINLADASYTNGPLATVISDVTTTSTELNQLDGISGNVTDTNLNTMTAGPSSDASALHKHASATTSYTAYETITTDDAVALLPIEVKHHTQLTEADLALGDNNARRRYSIKFTPSRVPNFTTKKFRMKDSTGNSTMTLKCTIETDNGGEPSGTPVTNGTANTVDSSTFTTNYGDKTFTWGAAPVMVAGTVYHLVIDAQGTDAVDYVIIGVNSTYDENYLTFTRQTYDIGAGTWGNSVTNATPFFWTVSEVHSLGMALCPTDANFGGRTWPFIGFAKAGGSAGDSIDVYTDTVPDLSSLEEGIDYWISETAGEISTSKPNIRYNGTSTSFGYRVGQAISKTDLKIDKGEKYVWGTISGSATTVTEVITWFKPKVVEIEGGATKATSPNSWTTSNGIYDGTNNYGATQAATDGSSATSGVETDKSFGASSNFAGVGSAISDGGFTYTNTKGGTEVNFAFLWKAKA